MQNIRNLLDIKLLSQGFGDRQYPDVKLENAKRIAQMYSTLENGISVLSDMSARRSYIYSGDLAEQLGLFSGEAEIKSIWEDELLSRVHAEDLQKKYRLEFQFFQMLNAIGIDDRADYQVMTRLRIKNREGRYVLIKHRLLYISSSEDGSAWLALCLYNLIYDHPEVEVPQGLIVNIKSGEVIDHRQQQLNDLLSSREKEILRLVKLGRRSKEIAYKLSLSINTVNRHRQNIFQKLNAGSAMEACRIAEGMGLL
jgi:DNA-binding CsgD family transcriptional regulator